MATLSGAGYAKEISSPKEKIENGKVFGKIHSARESYSLAGAVLALNDEILGPMLPKGAVIIDAKLMIDGTLGTGGILDLGYSASDDGVESEDTDAFVTGVDAGGAAALGRMAASNAGFHKQLAAPVRCKATVTEASSVSTGVNIYWDISYVIN